jgi:hypothetical protein
MGATARPRLPVCGAALPYELVLTPKTEGERLRRRRAARGVTLAAGDAIRRAPRAGATSLNAWLHDSADWHFELLPRLSILAGVELGAGWWINALAPEDAAETLRD